MKREASAELRQAAAFFVSTVELVRPEQWDQPALGQWSVRDLVGHTSRALLTIETYLNNPAEQVTINGPVEYYVRAAGVSPVVHEQVAQRGREAGQALGPDPISAVRTIAERVLPLVNAADEAVAIVVLGGGMRLGDYLATRTFELTVHSVDLASVIGAPVEPPAGPGRACLELAVAVAMEMGQGAAVLQALTGRQPLPPGFSVV